MITKKGLSSSFMINKKSVQSLNTSFQQAKRQPIEPHKASQSIFANNPNNQDNSNASDLNQLNTLKSRCQSAYEDYFQRSNILHGNNESFLIVKVSFKMKKNGILWTFGQLADFQLKKPEHLKNQRLLEELRGTTKKVRVMIPPENFNAYNQSRVSAASNRSSTSGTDRQSTSSSSSNGISSFQIDGLIIVESPIMLQYDLQ